MQNDANMDVELEEWWIDVIEGELPPEQMEEADWLIRRSSEAKLSFDFWVALKSEVKASDWVSKVDWDSDYLSNMQNRIMSQVEKKFPSPKPPRPS